MNDFRETFSELATDCQNARLKFASDLSSSLFKRIERREGTAAAEMPLPKPGDPAKAGAAQRAETTTLVAQVDAFFVRERGDWGDAPALRAGGKEPSHWRSAYVGTLFKLSDRVKDAAGRPLILDRVCVATCDGLDEFRQLLRRYEIEFDEWHVWD